MSVDPLDPNEELDAAYLFAEPELPPELPPPPPSAAPPRRKKKRRRREGEEPAPRPAGEVGDRILNREEESQAGWWKVPVWLIVAGLLLCLAPIIVLGVKQGATVGLAACLGVVTAMIVQIAVVTAFLAAVGFFFGIDYGPAEQAVVKLAAVVSLVDGLTGAMLLVNPCALVVAVVIGCGVFQFLFRLSVMEMILSVALMVGVAWGVNTFVVLYFVSKGEPPKALLTSEPGRKGETATSSAGSWHPYFRGGAATASGSGTSRIGVSGEGVRHEKWRSDSLTSAVEARIQLRGECGEAMLGGISRIRECRPPDRLPTPSACLAGVRPCSRSGAASSHSAMGSTAATS